MIGFTALLVMAAPAPVVPADWHVHVAVTIEADGHATDCKIVDSDAPIELQQKTCEIFRTKANFKPKLDAAGQPTRSTFETTVRFRQPS